MTNFLGQWLKFPPNFHHPSKNFTRIFNSPSKSFPPEFQILFKTDKSLKAESKKFYSHGTRLLAPLTDKMLSLIFIFIFSTSHKIALSCDIKSLFRKSVGKKLQIFNSIFHSFTFLEFFIMILFHSAISFDYKRNY